MNAQEKQKINKACQARYFKMKQTLRTFKIAFSICPLLIPLAMITLSFIGDKASYLEELTTWEGILLGAILGILIALTIAFWTWLEKVDLVKIHEVLNENLSINERSIDKLKDRIHDSEDPTKADFKLLLKIKKLEIEQVKLNFELELLGRCV